MSCQKAYSLVYGYFFETWKKASLLSHHVKHHVKSEHGILPEPKKSLLFSTY